ncbi:hypothetical protein O9992_21180 [Vibrio lentus]|nr:hypothetical protein [Vibrio lentus]
MLAIPMVLAKWLHDQLSADATIFVAPPLHSYWQKWRETKDSNSGMKQCCLPNSRQQKVNTLSIMHSFTCCWSACSSLISWGVATSFM